MVTCGTISWRGAVTSVSLCWFPANLKTLEIEEKFQHLTPRKKNINKGDITC